MWKFYQPVEIIFGNKEVNNLGTYLDQKGLNKANKRGVDYEEK